MVDTAGLAKVESAGWCHQCADSLFLFASKYSKRIAGQKLGPGHVH